MFFIQASSKQKIILTIIAVALSAVYMATAPLLAGYRAATSITFFLIILWGVLYRKWGGVIAAAGIAVYVIVMGRINLAMAGVVPTNPAGIISMWIGFMAVGIVVGMLADLVGRLAHSLTQRRKMVEELENQALSDALTGLGNRRHAEEVLRIEWARLQRGDTPCSVALLDIDHFKRVNDNYGHDVGDIVLQSVAETMTKSVRPTDYAFRWGGEEFLLVLPGSDVVGGKTVAERIREHVESTPLPTGSAATVSGGVSEISVQKSIEESLKAADTALYTAKEGGRNQICLSAS